MSYQQNSSRLRRLPDFFGITDSSGLIPLSQIRDNGILNNGLKPAEHETSTPGRSKKTDDERRLKHRKHRDTPER